MTRFIHIADLHHARHTGNAITAERSSFELQREKLDQLAHVIQSDSVQAILVAGDIEVSDPDDFLHYLIEWTALGASVYIVFGEHDVNRKEYATTWGSIPNVYCFLEPGYVIDSKLGVGIYGVSCESNQTGLSEQLDCIPDFFGGRPNILLSHGHLRHFSKEKMERHHFAYAALGDHHRYKNIQRGKTTLVYPGHLFSVWDGCGKAWETGYVLGTVNDQSITHTFYPFKGPQTRRICVNPFVRNGDRIELVLDNVNWEGENWIDDDEDTVRSVIRACLERYPNDFFVTPSNAFFPTRRLCMSGETLLKNPEYFEEFIQRSYKATARTQ